MSLETTSKKRSFLLRSAAAPPDPRGSRRKHPAARRDRAQPARGPENDLVLYTNLCEIKQHLKYFSYYVSFVLHTLLPYSPFDVIFYRLHIATHRLPFRRGSFVSRWEALAECHGVVLCSEVGRESADLLARQLLRRSVAAAVESTAPRHGRIASRQRRYTTGWPSGTP